jgi:hypothetical protein
LNGGEPFLVTGTPEHGGESVESGFKLSRICHLFKNDSQKNFRGNPVFRMD